VIEADFSDEALEAGTPLGVRRRAPLIVVDDEHAFA
jgi:hypothetical protein